MLDDAAPIAAITTAGLADRLDGHDCRSSMSVISRHPASTAQPGTALPAPAAGRHRLPDLHLGHHRCPQRRGDHPPQRHPAAASLDAGSAAARGCGRSGILGLRRLGVGDLRCAAARRAAGGGARVGGALTGRLARLAGREQVSVLSQTPSAAAVLPPEGLESVALVVAGEACPAEVVDRWAPGRVMINAYGPTETTVYVAISAPSGRGRGCADRVAGAGGGVVCAGWVVAAGAGRGGRGVVCGRCRVGVGYWAGPG